MALKPYRLVLLLFAATAVFKPAMVAAETLLRGPYLQQGDSDSIVIKWRSDVATDSRIEFGTQQGSLDQSVTHSTVTTEHEVEITGLDPSTRYYYNIGDTAGVLAGGDADHFFETSPVRGVAAATRIWVIGDAGTANSNQAAVYAAYRSYTGATYTNLWLMLGDNAYDDGTDAEYQAAVFNMYPELLRQTPLWSTLGNHDGHSADSATETGPYYQIFSFPRNGQVGGVASGTEAYYSFEYGNIHFVVLDSYETSRSTSGAMMNWLQADLQSVTADWLVAFWHHPPYSKGSHNSDSEGALIDMRENFLPVLESYGVDLVLSGHSHSYERSKLIDGHYGSSATFHSSHEVDGGSGRPDGTGAYVKNGSLANSGAVYAVAGASGKTSGGSLDHPAMYISLSQLGSMVIDVNGLTMDVKYISNTGEVSDYFTITKDTTPPTPPAAPSQLAADAGSSSSVSLNWTDNADNETGFDIERSLDGISWSLAGTAGINATGYVDTALTPNTTYHYRVRAKNSGGISDHSNVASATTLQALPTETVTLRDGENGFAGTEDSYVASGSPDSNWGTSSSLNTDGDDGVNGELVGLIRWDVSAIPFTAQVTTAQVTLEVFNISTGSYNLFAMTGPWNQSDVTWNKTNINSNQGVLVATLYPDPIGSYTLSLNTAGVNLVQGWVDGTTVNNGLMIRSSGTVDGVDIRSSEYSTVSMRPALVVTYENGAPQTPPADPSGLVATATAHDAIHLNWSDNSDNETGFDVERSLDSNDWSVVAMVNSNLTHYTDTGLNELTTYHYRIRANNSVGASGYSNIANATTQEGPTLPDAPSNLNAAAASSSTIDLSWVDNADNETGFKIEHSPDNVAWSQVATTGADVSNHTDTGLDPMSTYYYRLRATNGVGDSSYSNIASATTQQTTEPVTAVFRNGLNGYTGTQDSYVASGKTNSNYGGSSNLEADGSDGRNGELITLIKWDVSTISGDASVNSVSVMLRVRNRSRGAYGLYAMNGTWDESSVTWNNADVNTHQGVEIASVVPNPTGSYTLTLNAAGVALVQGWIDGTVANHGLMIRTMGTTDGMISRSSEYGTLSQRPTLTVTYQ